MDELFVAMQAGFGFVVVDFFVPRQLFLGMKDFSARTYVILQLLFQLQMVSVAMLNHV